MRLGKVAGVEGGGSGEGDGRAGEVRRGDSRRNKHKVTFTTSRDSKREQGLCNGVGVEDNETEQST